MGYLKFVLSLDGTSDWIGDVHYSVDWQSATAMLQPGSRVRIDYEVYTVTATEAQYVKGEFKGLYVEVEKRVGSN